MYQFLAKIVKDFIFKIKSDFQTNVVTRTEGLKHSAHSSGESGAVAESNE